MENHNKVSEKEGAKQIAAETIADSRVISIQHEKYNTHVQRVVELNPTELSMMDKRYKQQYVEISNIAYHNDDPINDQLENTGKFLFH